MVYDRCLKYIPINPVSTQNLIHDILAKAHGEGA